MKDDEKPRRWAGAILIAAGLVLLPMLYVLSSGPAAWLMTRHYLSVYWFDALYFPLNMTSGSELDWIYQRWGGYLRCWT